MNKTLIVYQSKYGSTKAIAQKLALILGPAAAIVPSDFNEKYMDFDTVVIGSPIYGEQIAEEIREFIQNNADWLKKKKIALFTVSLYSSCEKSFSDIQDLLGDCVVWQGSFGGVYDPEGVDENDSRAMKQFSKVTGFSNAYKNCLDEKSFVEKAVEMKRLLKNTLNMPQKQLKDYVEKFLLSHNTCTLCTGYDREVRATPIEYMYFDEALYFFTEGGEKFAHILVNPHVSVAVYDSYAGFQKLGGLQMNGTAEIISSESEEYTKIASKKGLNTAKLQSLPVALHLIKVQIHACEFLSSEIGRAGYEVRQAFLWTENPHEFSQCE